MKIKIKTNFDFGKLSNNMSNMISDYLSGYAQGAVDGTKKNINNSKNIFGKQITSYTAKKENRQALIDSGEMLKSISSKKNKMEIVEYGYNHNEGLWGHLRKETKTDNFIGSTLENEKIIDNKFAESVDKFLSK